MRTDTELSTKKDLEKIETKEDLANVKDELRED